MRDDLGENFCKLETGVSAGSFADESQEARGDEFRDGSLPPNRGMDRGAAKPCLYRSIDETRRQVWITGVY
jgi:hypothetical protein